MEAPHPAIALLEAVFDGRRRRPGDASLILEVSRLVTQQAALLAALRSLLHQVEYMGAPDDHPDMIAARAAIAQAEGRE